MKQVPWQVRGRERASERQVQAGQGAAVAVQAARCVCSLLSSRWPPGGPGHTNPQVSASLKVSSGPVRTPPAPHSHKDDLSAARFREVGSPVRSQGLGPHQISKQTGFQQ